MKKIIEMAESHLANVEREIVNLKERKVAIDSEIDKLVNYLEDGKKSVEEAKNN